MAEYTNPYSVKVVNPLEALMLGEQGYKEGKSYGQERALDETGRALAAGDFEGATAAAFRSGKIDVGLSLLKMKQQQDASKEFSSNVGGMYGEQKPTSPLAALMGGGQQASPYASAISSVESGGRYDALGPQTRDGDKAYGKYQVMGKNVGPWTKEVTGQEMTPEQFIASPEAQDAVFNAKFGQYAQKYGPEGAAKAWFAGEGGMNNPNARDILGTSVSDYGNRFSRAMGGTQVASIGGGVGAVPSQPARQQQVAQAPQSTQDAPQGDGITPKLRQLIMAVANPNLPAAQKELAKTLLTRELDNAKLPDPVKQYLFAKGQGFSGTFVDYQTSIRRAGATNVNVGDNSKKFDEELDKKSADRFNKYIENGDAARRKMVDIDTMREISTRLGSQGAAAGVKEAIGPYAEALGIPIDGLSDIQAYTQVIQRLAPQQRAPGSGSTSDIEFKGFIKSLPGLSQNPQAREVGLNTMEALTRDELTRGEIASRLSSKEITRVEAERELRALPDPMKSFSEWRKANPGIYGQALKGASSSPAAAKPSAPPMEGARKAPDGNWYIQQNGKTYRVDP